MRYRFFIAGGLVLTMIALCGGMVVSLTNVGAMIPSFSNARVQMPFFFGSNRYSATATEEKRFEVNAPAKINVENTMGKIDIAAGGGKEIVVAMQKKGFGVSQADADTALANLKIDLIQNGDAVTIKVAPQTVNAQVDFTITVPEQTAVAASNAFGDLNVSKTKGDVELKTNAGSIRVSEVQGVVKAQSDFGSVRLESIIADTVEVKSNAGAIRLKQVTVKETVLAKTDFGNVTLEQVSAKSYDLKTNAGKIEVNGVTGLIKAYTDFGGVEISGGDKAKLDLKSNSGSVRYSGSLGDGPHKLKTDMGGITLVLPKDSVLTADLKTDLGSIKSDLPLTISGTQSRTHWTGNINGGGASLIAETNNGSIAIEILK